MMIRGEKITETTAGFCDIIDVTANFAPPRQIKTHNGLIALMCRLHRRTDNHRV
jgi:hypothetical protein